MLTIILMKQSNMHFFMSFLQVVDFLPQTELSLVNYVRLLNQNRATEL